MNSFNRGASPRPTPGFPARSGIVSCGRGGFLPPRGIRLKQAAGGVSLPAAGR